MQDLLDNKIIISKNQIKIRVKLFSPKILKSLFKYFQPDWV